MNRNRTLFFLLLSLAIGQPLCLKASPPRLRLDSLLAASILQVDTPKIRYEPGKMLSPDEVLMRPFFTDLPHEGEHIWLYLSSRCVNITEDTVYTRVFGGYFDHVHVFSRTGNGAWQERRSGRFQPKSDSESRLMQWTVPLNFPPHDTVELLVATRGRWMLKSRNVWIERPETSEMENLRLYFERQPNLALYQGSFAILVFQVFFVLGLFAMAAKPAYLYYALYVLSFGLFVLIRYASYLFLPYPSWWQPIWGESLALCLPFFAYYAYFRFVNVFLQIPERSPTLAVGVKWAWRISAAFSLLSLALYGFLPDLIRQVYFFVSFFLMGMVIWAIVRVLRFREPDVYLIALGSTIFYLGVSLGFINRFLITFFGVYIPLDVDVLFICFVVEIFLFSLALAYTFRREETQKRLVQEKLVARLEENQRLRENMDHMRTQVARDLHDDIGSTLSSITLYSDLALRQSGQKRASDLLSRIREASQEMNQAMRETLWTLQPNQDPPEAFLRRVVDHAYAVLGPAGVRVKVAHGEWPPALALDMYVRQSLFLLAKEAINNTAKYARATEVNISMFPEQGGLSFRISDNGTGFDSAAAGGGNGLANMRSRVFALGGTIEMVTAPGRGVEIQVWIPLPENGDAS